MESNPPLSLSGTDPRNSRELERGWSLSSQVALGLLVGIIAPLCAMVVTVWVMSAEVRVELFLVTGFALFAFLSALVLMVLHHRKVVRPIRKLSVLAGKLDAGDLDIEAPEDGVAEVGVLGQSFNQMAASIRDIVAQADAIARGDYSADIKPRSDRDTLGEALHSMTQTLRELAQVSERVAAGDLTVAVSIKGDGDLLGRAVNQMIRNLRDVAEQIEGSGLQMLSASREQVQGAKNQSVATEEMSSTVSELITSAHKMAENAAGVASQAALATEECRQGKVSVESTVEGIRGVHERVQRIASHMLELGGKSQQISGVLDIITELSEQTNLLSLNASIEAAGAGEAGKRFAVVASEVRKLAERATGSAGEIRALIDSIQETVNATIMSTEEGSKAVAEGVHLAEELDSFFGRIAEQVTATTQAAKAIEMGTRQQTTAMDQMEGAVKNVDTGAQQTAETACRLDESVHALMETASLLQKSVQVPQAM